MILQLCFIFQVRRNTNIMLTHMFQNRGSNFCQQFPKCITRPICTCFEEIRPSNVSKSDTDSYISEVTDRIEYFLHLIEIHQNKESIIEVPYVCKVSAKIFRGMVYFMNHTRRKFCLESRLDENVYVDFPRKPIKISEYLHHLLMYYIYLDSTINTLLYPESELTINSLDEVLKIHLELLFIFRQYCNFKKYGYTFSMIAPSGSINNYQLYCY